MGKYDTLARYLQTLQGDSNTLSFRDIEGILGFSLPESARRYRPWWANDRTHVQALDGWLGVGWTTDIVELDEEVVMFKKEGKPISEKTKTSTLSRPTERKMTSRAFENLAKDRLSEFFHEELEPRRKKGWPKLFDFVSKDFQIVGDAKYLSMVGGERLPPAKFSVIAEHVWMLEKLDAKIKFLVFGNDKRVVEEWLQRYERFVDDVQFYFLHGDELSKLK